MQNHVQDSKIQLQLILVLVGGMASLPMGVADGMPAANVSKHLGNGQWLANAGTC